MRTDGSATNTSISTVRYIKTAAMVYPIQRHISNASKMTKAGTLLPRLMIRVTIVASPTCHDHRSGSS